MLPEIEGGRIWQARLRGNSAFKVGARPRASVGVADFVITSDGRRVPRRPISFDLDRVPGSDVMLLAIASEVRLAGAEIISIEKPDSLPYRCSGNTFSPRRRFSKDIFRRKI